LSRVSFTSACTFRTNPYRLIDQLLRQTLAGEIWVSPSNACLTHVKLGMPSLPVGDVYIHPDATSSVIPHLKAHLPHASTELYVVQVPPAPDSTVFATFPPAESPLKSRDWAVGVLGITGMPETELWFWSSVEGTPAIDVDEDREERFRSAYAQFEQMFTPESRPISPSPPETARAPYGTNSFSPKIVFLRRILAHRLLDQNTSSKGWPWRI